MRMVHSLPRKDASAALSRADRRESQGGEASHDGTRQGWRLARGVMAGRTQSQDEDSGVESFISKKKCIVVREA